MQITLIGPAEPRQLLSRSDLPVGYGGVAVNALAQLLANGGHSVAVITGSEGVSQTQHWSDPVKRMAVWTVPFRRGDRTRLRNAYATEICALTQALREAGGDVIHAHWTYEFALAALSAREDAVVTARDAPLSELLIERRPGLLIRAGMAVAVRRRVTNLTANSPYTATRWRREMAYRHDIPTVMNPVDFPLGFGFVHASKPRAPSGKVNFLAISNTGRAKNIPELLRTWPHIADRLPGSSLTLIGHGLTPTYCERHLGQPRRDVLALGPLDRPDVFKLIEACDVIVHPSIQESIGNPVLEGMSQRRLVVADRRCTAIVELSGDGHDCLLVDFSKPTTAAEQISSAWNQTEQREAIIDRAYTRVTALCSPKIVLAKWEQIYARVTAGVPVWTK